LNKFILVYRGNRTILHTGKETLQPNRARRCMSSRRRKGGGG
jgi:hypothetical protein